MHILFLSACVSSFFHRNTRMRMRMHYFAFYPLCPVSFAKAKEQHNGVHHQTDRKQRRPWSYAHLGGSSCRTHRHGCPLGCGTPRSGRSDRRSSRQTQTEAHLRTWKTRGRGQNTHAGAQAHATTSEQVARFDGVWVTLATPKTGWGDGGMG